MKRSLFPILALTLAAGAMSARAETTSVDKLIADLSSDDWAARETAEDNLVNQGAAATEAINKALAATSDVDVQERLRSALARIGGGPHFR
jgi:hypothetical protein